tara:strand:+ start:1461 stop:2240 length:780 start_codon:yes stop_codon:yes gene_type:complete
MAYSGFVSHLRHRPKKHLLKYRVFYLLLNLGELEKLDRKLKLFSYNRPGIFSFYDIDHGARDGTSLVSWVFKTLKKAEIDIEGGRVMLMCLPRMLGYVFNPVSIYFCYNKDDSLNAILYEVNNTFGESHTYVVPIGNDGLTTLKHSFDKVFYVSPFVSMDCIYNMAITPPDRGLSITMEEADIEGPLLAAVFRGKGESLTNIFLSLALIRYPFMTIKVIAGIYWEAFNLWRKRIPIFHHQPTKSASVSIVSPRSGFSNE